MLCAGLRQLGDGAADRDADGAASCWNSVFEHYYGPATFNDWATDSNYHTGGRPDADANAKHTRDAAVWRNANYSVPWNVGHTARHRYNAESIEHTIYTVRRTNSGGIGHSFESWDDESRDTGINHAELVSEFRCAGFQQSWFAESIAAEFG